MTTKEQKTIDDLYKLVDSLAKANLVKSNVSHD